MYKDGLNIMPWPIFNDAAWFRSLTKVKNILDQQEAKYENARIFLQNTKVIMAKLKVCFKVNFRLPYHIIYIIHFFFKYRYVIGVR